MKLHHLSSRMRSIARLLAVSILAAATTSVTANFLWCDRHVDNAFDDISAAVSSSDDVMSAGEIDDVIQQTFARVMCDVRVGPADCATVSKLDVAT